MKKTLWLIAGVCAATAGFLVFGAKRVRPIAEMAHDLDAAWADHHTIL